MKTSDMNNNFEYRIDLDNNLFAPISQGQVVGKVVYTIDGVEYSSDLIATHSVIPSNSYIAIVGIILLVFVLFILFKLLFPKKKNIDT